MFFKLFPLYVPHVLLPPGTLYSHSFMLLRILHLNEQTNNNKKKKETALITLSLKTFLDSPNLFGLFLLWSLVSSCSLFISFANYLSCKLPFCDQILFLLADYKPLSPRDHALGSFVEQLTDIIGVRCILMINLFSLHFSSARGRGGTGSW